MQPTTPPQTVDITVEQIADLLSTVAAANVLIAEADRISSSRAAVSLATLERLTNLTAELRPCAEARAMLSEVDPDLLLAGTAVWLGRRRLVAASHSAAARAANRWNATASREHASTSASELGA